MRKSDTSDDGDGLGRGECQMRGDGGDGLGESELHTREDGGD